MQVCSNMVHAQRNSSIKFGVDLTCFGKISRYLRWVWLSGELSSASTTKNLS